jgi:endogenous inhibitor of DNA gyrase (YacG/DUF329 family)
MNSERCPICGEELPATLPRDAAHRPFCSERCRLIDLGRWLGERYRLAEPDPDEPVAGNAPCESAPP